MVVGIQGIGKTSLLEILRQEGGSFKRKPTEHWAKRMGNKNINMKTGTYFFFVKSILGQFLREFM